MKITSVILEANYILSQLSQTENKNIPVSRDISH